MIDILDIIEKINAQKKDALKTPTSATLNEVMSEVTLQVKNEINQMVRERKIVYNKTLNSFSFKVADWKSHTNLTHPGKVF